MSLCQIKENKRKMSLEEKREKLVISLSDLPVEILEHILSFLKTRDAVRTSILSKRWEYLWKHTPNLDFNETCFPNRSQFFIIVGRAIFLRKSIKSFHLKCCVRDDASLITSLITAVVMRNVQELSLVLRPHMSLSEALFVLPNCLFSSKSLVKLKLSWITFNLSSSICFPSLKTLTLEHVVFPDEHLTHQLFSSCSVLEELTLIYCSWYSLKDKVIHVCAPKLLRFTIYEDTGYTNCIGCHVMVHGANLKHYDHTGIFQIEHCVSGSTSLDSARIAVISPQYVRKEYHRMHRLLGCLSSAKDLTLLSHTFEVSC